MTWRLIALLNLVSFACGCHIHDEEGYLCPPKYPVAPGDHGYFYQGTGEIRVVSSVDIEAIDSTFLLTADVQTVDEETNFESHGIREPLLYFRIVPFQPTNRLGCYRFVPDPPEVIQLSLDGSDNHFRCFGDPESDAELVLRNVGEGAGVEPLPDIRKAELVGTYSEGGGAELYEIRLQPFSKELMWLPCSDPMAKR